MTTEKTIIKLEVVGIRATHGWAIGISLGDGTGTLTVPNTDCRTKGEADRLLTKLWRQAMAEKTWQCYGMGMFVVVSGISLSLGEVARKIRTKQ